MPTTPTVAVTSTRAVVQAAERRGVDVDALLADHGLTRPLLDDQDARLPAPVAAVVWRDAARAAREPELPVWAALELEWKAYRVIDLLAASSATVGEALEMLARYFRIINDSIRLELVELPGSRHALEVHRADGGPVPPPYLDYTLAACIYRMHYAAGVPIHPEVHRTRSAPADRTAHERALGPHLHFDSDRDRAVLDEAQWSTPMLACDPVLRSVLAEHAGHIVDSLPEPVDLLREVREALWELMPRGRAELARVARAVDVSPRTLQRRLAAAGTSWSELLGDTRRDLAAELLADRTLSIDDVAVLLGYAEASAFHRAFRRWTGTTPGQWRAQHA
jgi:AraC-like DNA-binding protein